MITFRDLITKFSKIININKYFYIISERLVYNVIYISNIIIKKYKYSNKS